MLFYPLCQPGGRFFVEFFRYSLAPFRAGKVLRRIPASETRWANPRASIANALGRQAG